MTIALSFIMLLIITSYIVTVFKFWNILQIISLFLLSLSNLFVSASILHVS